MIQNILMMSNQNATISTIYLHSTNNCISRRVPGHVKQQQPQLVPPRGQARQVEEVLLRPVARGQQGVEGESYLLESMREIKRRYVEGTNHYFVKTITISIIQNPW